jgi:hypothetical protein
LHIVRLRWGRIALLAAAAASDLVRGGKMQLILQKGLMGVLIDVGIVVGMLI